MAEGACTVAPWRTLTLSPLATPFRPGWLLSGSRLESSSWAGTFSPFDRPEPASPTSVLDNFWVSLSPEPPERELPPSQEALQIPQPGASDSTVDVQQTIAAFRDRCRKTVTPLLPRPKVRKPQKKRTPPETVRRSNRIAGRFGLGASIKQQQQTLMVQLGIAHEGEERLAAVLAIFGWHPDALPLEADDVDGLVI